MIDIAILSDAELTALEDKRQEELGNFMIETRSKNPFVNELKFNYDYVHLRDFDFIGMEGNKLELRIKENERKAELAFISVSETNRRIGIGTKMMDMLCHLADKYGYMIDLHVKGKFGVRDTVLVEFYKKFGFEQVRMSHYMVRNPN